LRIRTVKSTVLEVLRVGIGRLNHRYAYSSFTYSFTQVSLPLVACLVVKLISNLIPNW